MNDGIYLHATRPNAITKQSKTLLFKSYLILIYYELQCVISTYFHAYTIILYQHVILIVIIR